IIYLKGVFLEGNYKKMVELNPSPFNVVLADGTYQGQITLGLKFIPNVSLPPNCLFNWFTNKFLNFIKCDIFLLCTSSMYR
ncbi:hypothetical protein F511_21395, partial [Dorcoceras hygrometricum]